MYHKQTAAASIFIVVFTALMVTVVTVGFTQIMIRNHEQSQAADLSQSAYDAALAGVEDAKRILVYYASNCENTTVPAGNCSQVSSAMSAKKCTTAVASGLVPQQKIGTESEVQVGSNELNQSYTCLKIQQLSMSYPGTVSPENPSIVLPLQPKGASATTLQLWWFSKQDAGDKALDTAGFSDPTAWPLVKATDWSATASKLRPPVIRAQYIPDGMNDEMETKTQTVFGYPKSSGGIGNVDTPRRSKTFRISSAKCDSDFNGSPGVCSITLSLIPSIADGSVGYVQLSGLYLSGDVTMTAQLLDASGTVIPLRGIPTVDSTGRAAERLRRVVAQVRVGTIGISNRPQPRAAIDTTGNLCKTFFVTDNPNDYTSGSCDPAN